MQVFLTAFGMHNPFAGPRLQEHSRMPIAIDADGGFDLDYSAILIAESFIVDSQALEFIRDRRGRFLAPMWNSLEVLRAEGLLKITDYGDPCLRFRDQIVQKTIALIEDVHPWWAIAREQWTRVRSEFEDFARSYSDPLEREFDGAHYGVVSYLERRDGRVDPRESARLHGLLTTRRRKLKTPEEAEMREVLKPLVAQVLMNDLLRYYLQSPFIDWDDTEKFYQRLHLGQWADIDESNVPGAEIANQARCLFRMVVPELLPGRIEDVVTFLRSSRAVASLRRELWSLMREGGSPSKEWMLRLHNEAARAQLRVQSRGRVIKWAGRLVDLVLPGVGLAGEVLVNAAGDAAEGLVTKKTRGRFEWYYALQRIQMRK